MGVVRRGSATGEITASDSLVTEPERASSKEPLTGRGRGEGFGRIAGSVVVADRSVDAYAKMGTAALSNSQFAGASSSVPLGSSSTGNTFAAGCGAGSNADST